MSELTIDESVILYKWKLETNEKILKVIDANRHHQKFSKRITAKVQSELGEKYLAYLREEKYLSPKMTVLDRTYFSNLINHATLHNSARIDVYINNDAQAGWYSVMATEINRSIDYLKKRIERLMLELQCVGKLMDLEESLQAAENKAREKALSLLPPYEEASPWTYEITSKFPRLLGRKD